MHPIGILDSGVGGLTVWREIIRELPFESIIYIADSKNTPYGIKTEDEIYQLAKRMVDFLLKRQVKIIVIACNTITVSCLNRLRSEYPEVPLIGTVPVIKTAAEVTENGRIAVFSTTRTAESKYQKDLIQKYAQNCEVYSIGSDELVPLIENGEVSGQRLSSVLERVLSPLKENGIDILAIACTHYPFIEYEIQKVLGTDVQLLEPSAAVARHTKRILSQNNVLTFKKSQKYFFYTSGEVTSFLKVAKKLLGITIQAEYIDL